MITANLSAIFYLVSGVLFILALRGLSSPETSRQGNFYGIMGMIIAITVDFPPKLLSVSWIRGLHLTTNLRFPPMFLPVGTF